MHGGINILHADTELKKAKREGKEAEQVIESAKRARQEARYQARLADEVVAVNRRVEYLKGFRAAF